MLSNAKDKHWLKDNDRYCNNRAAHLAQTHCGCAPSSSPALAIAAASRLASISVRMHQQTKGSKAALCATAHSLAWPHKGQRNAEGASEIDKKQLLGYQKKGQKTSSF